MKRNSHFLIFLITVLLLFPAYGLTAHANSAEPPCFTILVQNPPEDLTLSVQLPGESNRMEPIALTSHQKAWEAYYRLFYHMFPDRNFDSDALEGTVLIVSSNEKQFQCTLPAETFSTYNNLLTLDLDSETLTVGQPALRVPLLTSMRVILTLAIEGVIFYLFGYRKKTSWILFLIVNLITQISLNLTISGPVISGYWVIGFVLSEILILIFESILFCFAREQRKLRGFLYAIVANIASLFLGGLLISRLPV